MNYYDIFPALILEKDTSGDYPLYKWQELGADGQGDYLDAGESLFARFGSKARELEDRNIAIGPNGVRVWMRVRGAADGEDVFEFAANTDPVFVQINGGGKDSYGNFSAYITRYNSLTSSWDNIAGQVWVRSIDNNPLDVGYRCAAMLIGSNPDDDPLYTPLTPRDEIVFTVRLTIATLRDEEG